LVRCHAATRAATHVLRSERRTGELAQVSGPEAKIFTIFEGTSEIQRMIIGRAVTGLDVR
jgi:alkylation response protein AidB-like acyl-CoA dehydrogenase